MSAAVEEVQIPLSKVDSAIDDAPASPSDNKPIRHRRTSSTVSGVFNINDLGKAQLAHRHDLFLLIALACRKGRSRAQDRSRDPEAQLVSISATTAPMDLAIQPSSLAVTGLLCISSSDSC